MMIPLPLAHFPSHPPTNDVVAGGDELVDTIAPAASYNFDIDTQTGFMPPEPPICRLPIGWEPWEMTLEEALSMKLQLAVKPDLTVDETVCSSSWRKSVQNNLPILSTTGLAMSEQLLRRAHHVLTFIMHLYIHTLPLDAEIRIPPSISVPLLEVAAHLQLPPVATHSDTILHNWRIESPVNETVPPALDNLRSQDLFTGTNDEQEFYLASARIEIRGGEALQLMRATIHDMRIGDESAVRRIIACLHRLGALVDVLTQILLDVREGCDPEIFYHRVRPWLRGEDSDPMHRKWIFEGLEGRPELAPPTDLSGPSAGQSALIHAFDIFLGLDERRGDDDRWTLLRRMRAYMPKHHRDFLARLAVESRPLRDMVTGGDSELAKAYNDAVRAVKGFRDAHIRIVTLYIIIPASRERRETKEAEEAGLAGKRIPLKGTGGTHLVQFLKGVRDKTGEAIIGAGSVTVLRH